MNDVLYFQNLEGDVLSEYELADAHLEFLNGQLPVVEIGDLQYLAGNVLREVDPIAFREDFLNYLDSFEWHEVPAGWNEVPA